ncbi:MAG: anhydro-N-acetylmuramic acid kinase [Saprospiraceae bacterium]|nr:anhydro-N-acetylmuramic acid kinase [Saprospiraceae bacterium]
MAKKTDCFLEYHTTIPYLPSFKKSIQKVFAKKKIDFSHLCQLNAFLGNWYAEQINLILSDQKIRPDKIDLIASHGQTGAAYPPSYSILQQTFNPSNWRCRSPCLKNRNNHIF